MTSLWVPSDSGRHRGRSQVATFKTLATCSMRRKLSLLVWLVSRLPTIDTNAARRVHHRRIRHADMLRMLVVLQHHLLELVLPESGVMLPIIPLVIGNDLPREVIRLQRWA